MEIKLERGKEEQAIEKANRILQVIYIRSLGIILEFFLYTSLFLIFESVTFVTASKAAFICILVTRVFIPLYGLKPVVKIRK